MARLSLILYILFSLLTFYRDSFATCKEITVETLNTSKNFCINTEVDIQKAIDYASRNGGGVIYLSAGVYKISNPIYLKPYVSVIGKPNLTKIVVESEFAITQYNRDIIDSVMIKDLIFINGNSNKVKAVFNITGGLQHSIFENLRFIGFKNETIFYVAPNFKGIPPRNVIFNTFRNIVADSCGKCVVYYGQWYSLISENYWENVAFLGVKQKAIEAINWVDTEKWYNLYARAMAPDTILIDINSNNLEHAHGFHFYSPSLVYDWSLITSPKKPVAIRLGKGTIRNIFIGVATDKVWDRFLEDSNAQSYYIIMDTVEDRTKLSPDGKKTAVKIIKKGVIEK